MIGGTLWFKLSVNIECISGTLKLVKCQPFGLDRCSEGIRS